MMNDRGESKHSDPYSSRALIIFIKNPVLGEVKTRLATEVGAQEALRIYQKLLTFTRGISSKVRASKVLYYSKRILDDEWGNDLYIKRVQHEGNLGQKMAGAFSEELKTFGKAILIGSDCPQISPEIIEEGFASLDIHDIVLGPSKDGGYYLVGMKKFIPGIFRNITWSTDSVLDETIERFSELHLSYQLLEELADVDHYEDWLRYGGDL